MLGSNQRPPPCKFAKARSRPSLCVRQIGLPMGFSAYRRRSRVRCVPACTGRVAVRLQYGCEPQKKTAEGEHPDDRFTPLVSEFYWGTDLPSIIGYRPWPEARSAIDQGRPSRGDGCLMGVSTMKDRELRRSQERSAPGPGWVGADRYGYLA